DKTVPRHFGGGHIAGSSRNPLRAARSCECGDRQADLNDARQSVDQEFLRQSQAGRPQRGANRDGRPPTDRPDEGKTERELTERSALAVSAAHLGSLSASARCAVCRPATGSVQRLPSISRESNLSGIGNFASMPVEGPSVSELLKLEEAMGRC